MNVIAAFCALLSPVLLASCDRPPDDSTDASLPTVVQISPDGARHADFAYSPDGKRIAYWAPSDSTSSLQLWVANADLSSPLKLPVTATLAGEWPIWSPDGARIAAASSDYGVSDVVVVPSTGGDAKRVTNGVGMEVPLRWLPDNDRVAYFGSAAGGTLISAIASVSTGRSTPLAPAEKRLNLGSPSPDGSHVAYFVIDGINSTVWVADSNGTNPRQLTTEGFESLEQYNEWSPDGKELLYQSRRTGTTDLWIVPIDGGKPRQLTRDVRNDWAGSWSPDGKWIAFLSNRGRQTDVWVVPSAGGEERRITDTRAIEDAPLAWRRGTNELSFITSSTHSVVWSLDVAHGTEQQLTPDTLRANWFNISPDGRQLTVVFNRGGGVHELAVMPIGGGELRRIVTGNGTVDSPRWSPDGSKIVFDSDRGGTADVWVVDATGGTPRQLVNWAGLENGGVWNADGSAVYFSSDRDSKLGDLWKVAADGGEPVRVTHEGTFTGMLATRPGVPDIFAPTISKREGRLSITRVRADGSVQTVWERTNAALGTPSISPAGDSLATMVEQSDGKFRSMIIPAGGGEGRVILNPGEEVGDWSSDGKSLLYQTNRAGSADIGIFNVRDGTTRVLTNTPDNEEGAEITRDGKTVVFRRTRTVQRISRVDLGAMLRTVARD
jgi:Tol biopolymer transport system component